MTAPSRTLPRSGHRAPRDTPAEADTECPRSCRLTPPIGYWNHQVDYPRRGSSSRAQLNRRLSVTPDYRGTSQDRAQRGRHRGVWPGSDLFRWRNRERRRPAFTVVDSYTGTTDPSTPAPAPSDSAPPTDGSADPGPGSGDRDGTRTATTRRHPGGDDTDGTRVGSDTDGDTATDTDGTRVGRRHGRHPGRRRTPTVTRATDTDGTRVGADTDGTRVGAETRTARAGRLSAQRLRKGGTAAAVPPLSCSRPPRSVRDGQRSRRRLPPVRGAEPEPRRRSGGNGVPSGARPATRRRCGIRTDMPQPAGARPAGSGDGALLHSSGWRSR